MDSAQTERRTGIEAASSSLGSLVVDERELLRFVKWLPPISPGEAYEVVLMVRSTGLRDEYGFKGSDHKLDSRLVHGYLSERLPDAPGIPLPGAEHWRLRLYEDVKKLAVAAVGAEWYYVKYRPGTRVPEAVYKIPHQLMGLYVAINPASVMRAALSTVKDVLESVWTMAESGSRNMAELFRRPDTRYHANAMKHSVTRFHTIDIDDPGLAARVLKLVREELGFRPATIRTRRGIHILVNLPALEERGVISRWVGTMSRDAKTLLTEYKKQPAEGRETLRRALEDYVWGSSDPLFHRLSVASEIYKNERGGSLVEVKKKPLEPVPGTLYKGVVARFEPEEGWRG